MKIVINEDTVGELSDEGEITTDDIWLMKLANKIRRQKLMDLRTRKTKHEHYGYLITVKKGDLGYGSAVAKILLHNEHRLKE